MSALPEFILTVRCPDTKGLVAAVSTALAACDFTIVEATQFNDPVDEQFFMRVVFRPCSGAEEAAAFERAFAPVAERFAMTWGLRSAAQRPRTLIAVSKFGHCLTDLIHRWKAGSLPVDIVGVVSNHEDFRAFVEWSALPFHHLPITPDSKPAQERRFLDLVDALDVDLLVLARYMQVLSPAFCDAVAGRCINIHHSFLPGFKGANPYKQAHARGVKIIGATAHYVTADLDEGPIIEQAVERVEHSHSPADLMEIGRDIECAVLARAVRWHAEGRVMLNGVRTIVFS
ncbi:MAG: formyltetrahydrofolate deformylase [Hyphomonadaceae bacterium]|nr:formyltetrahydrofolate deformylase [Hyphomonadaceae bacterium]